jgi:hypothetical protein
MLPDEKLHLAKRKIMLLKSKRKAKKGKGTKANPYAIGLGASVPKTRSDVKKLGEPR